MKLRYRWYGPIEDAPMIGCYLMSIGPRPRGGYLITGIKNMGKRGGFGRAIYHQLVLTTERVSVEDARRGPLFGLKWDRRIRRRS